MMELVIGEDGLARERKEPYAIFECPTKKDADKLNEMIQDVIKKSGQSEDDCGFYIYKYDIA